MGSSSEALGIAAMFRALLFAAVIASSLSQNFRRNFRGSNQQQRRNRNFNTFTRFNPANGPTGRPVGRQVIQANAVGTESRDGKSLDMFDETRRQADAVKSTLKKLASNSVASGYMKKIFSSGECIDNIDEAIDAIEEGASIIEGARPEITKLLSTVRSIDNTTDFLVVTRTSAVVLRQLENLLPKLAPSKNDVCGSTFKSAFNTMEAVGKILNEISEDENLALSKKIQLELKISKVIVDAISTFLTKLKDIFDDLKGLCTSHERYNVRSFDAIGKMLEGLADLFLDLGDTKTSEDIREKTKLTEKIATAIEIFPETKFEKLDCNSPGDFETSATMLEDLAQIIEEVGLDRLKKQLGVEDLINF